MPGTTKQIDTAAVVEQGPQQPPKMLK